MDERHKAWRIHCGRPLAALTRTEDHVPTKSLLRKPRPHHLPVVTICQGCNTGFSRDEQYVMTFLDCVLAGSTRPHRQSNASAARALELRPALREAIERSCMRAMDESGGERLVWKPDSERVDQVVVKNA